MKSLLIINKKQFGYHTDSYQLSLYLQKDFNITFVCFDMNYPLINTEGVSVVYVSHKGNFFSKGFRFFKACFKHLKNEFDYRFLSYFSLCSLLQILTKAPIILDFRTGSVNTSRFKRKLDDGLKHIETKFFKEITVISKGLQQLLRIPDEKAYILPLGANILSQTGKTFLIPKLLYVGTLNNRHIEKTIEGVAIFLSQNPEFRNSLTFDIVGDGYNNEVDLLKTYITKYELGNNIKLHGRRTHKEIQQLFDQCNLGVSFVPLTEYYDHQPPTKTFEYVLSGMCCLATATSENRKYVNEQNGILHVDTPEGFAHAIDKSIKHFNRYNSSLIRQTLIEFTWSNIATDFKNYLLANE